MEYIKQNFVDGQTLKADHLNHMEDGIANASGGGGSSWNDLTDKPFYHKSTPTVGMEKQTIEIVQKESGYGTVFGGTTNGFGDIIASVSPDTGKGCSFTTNFEAGDKIVVTLDGVDYETILTNNGAHGYYAGNGMYYCGYNTSADDTSWSFYFTLLNESGFDVWMSEENVGTHEISIQVYREEHKNLDEEFIPDTIVRVGTAPTIKPSLPGGAHVIPAGETHATNWSSQVSTNIYLEIGAPIEYDTPFILATGEYVDSEGVKHFVDGIRWKLTEREIGEWIGKNLVILVVEFFIDEPFDYDITVNFVSNYEFGGSMG